MAEIWSIQDFFWYGLHRRIEPLLMPPEGIQLNLGPGRRKEVPDAIGIGLETGWCAPAMMEFPDGKLVPEGSIAAIHCYQFIEHLSGDDAVRLLREMERVLMPGGVVYLASPFYKSAMAYQALDHKSWWNEEIWHWLFGNEYYDDHEGEGWQLKVHACFIMGVVERNINLFTQLVKEARDGSDASAAG